MRLKFFLLMTFVFINNLNVIAQGGKTEIVGTVVGKDRIYGHIYDSNAVNKRLLIVRVDEKLKEKVDSKYVLVKYIWHLKDEKTPYNNENATQWKFILTREKDCDSTLEKLQFSYFSTGNKITGMFPQIDRTWGIDFENLPFEKTLPCYKLESKNLSQIETFTTDSNKIPRTDKESFVLKDSILINPSQTPLEIGIFRNGLFVFTNTSDKTISNYTFGCVAEKDGKIIVTDEINSEETELSEKSSVIFPKGSGGTINYTEQIKSCYDKKSKLAIIKVSFQDKSIWQVNAY